MPETSTSVNPFVGVRAAVVGSASGIGRAVAADLGVAGAHVALLDVAEEAVATTAKGLRDDGVEVAAALACDVTDRSSVDAAFARTVDVLGGLDVMVNAAGIAGYGRFVDLTASDWMRIIAVNLHGAFHCGQAAARAMLAGAGERDRAIVTISSQAAFHGQALIAPYAAAKAAVLNLTRTMALELAPHIRVNAVCPGEVATPMMEQRLAHFAQSSGIPVDVQRDDLRAAIPLGRFQTPESIAAVVRFVCSPQARDITGQAVVVDGGTLA
jgi:NAD(P)-dependent dehydrogenase (short-subunit alcohol dehydrogenase family)